MWNTVAVSFNNNGAVIKVSEFQTDVAEAAPNLMAVAVIKC